MKQKVIKTLALGLCITLLLSACQSPIGKEMPQEHATISEVAPMEDLQASSEESSEEKHWPRVPR